MVTVMLGDYAETLKGKAVYRLGISAGEDREFAEKWADIFELEYEIRPRVYRYARSGILALIKCRAVYERLWDFATFGIEDWLLNLEYDRTP